MPKDVKNDGSTGGHERGGARKPLRVVISEIDQEILRLLVRRANLLSKLCEKGRVPVTDDKYLREAWQNDVARVSRDPELSGRFFALMQNLTFLPRPVDASKPEGRVPGSERREAFNLAPPALPVHLSMIAPLSGEQTCAWLYLAAAAGQKIRLSPCLQNDPLVDYVHGLAQIGAAITREEDAIITRSTSPLGAPDKAIHVGPSEFAFFIFLAHYLGRHSHVKFSGDPILQLADFSAIRTLAQALGARLVHIVPKSAGLPCRLEASGILPAGVSLDMAIPTQFAIALILAAPFYESPFTVDLANHPQRDSIFARALPLLEKSGAVFSLQTSSISIQPSNLLIPEKPIVPMDSQLAAFLLAFAAALGGEVKLKGKLADWIEDLDFWQLCAGYGFTQTAAGIECKRDQPIKVFDASAFDVKTEWQAACVCALAACAALKQGTAKLPQILTNNENAVDFLRIANLKMSESGQIEQIETKRGLAWNAPTPAWALALAIGACCRSGKAGWQLGNPGIIMELWPPFWAYYNSLPNPAPKRKAAANTETAKPRRRIITDAVAIPPEIRSEDWD